MTRRKIYNEKVVKTTIVKKGQKNNRKYLPLRQRNAGWQNLVTP